MFCEHCGAELKEGAKFCENCGKALEIPLNSAAKENIPELSGETENVNSPEEDAALQAGKEAGTSVEAMPAPKPGNLANEPMALAGFIVSLASLLINPVCIVSLVGLILSIIGLVKVKKAPETYKGKGMAIAGVVIGAANTVFCVLTIIFAVAITGEAIDWIMSSL